MQSPKIINRKGAVAPARIMSIKLYEFLAASTRFRLTTTPQTVYTNCVIYISTIELQHGDHASEPQGSRSFCCKIDAIIIKLNQYVVAAIS